MSEHSESTSAGVANLIGLGALLLVADYLIFEVILDEYFFSTILLLTALFALFGHWMRRNHPEASWPIPYGWTMRLLGYTAGTLALVELLYDLRNGVLDNLGDILGGLIVYAGAFLMFRGARQLAGDIEQA